MEFQGARENNMEEEEEAAEERIYVAVGSETAKNKSNLTWAIDNSEGRKICIVLVHQPAQMIPVCKFFLSPSLQQLLSSKDSMAVIRDVKMDST